MSSSYRFTDDGSSDGSYIPTSWPYFCHQCNGVVSATTTPDVRCFTCGGDFVEEYEGNNSYPVLHQPPPAAPVFRGGGGGFPLILSTSSGRGYTAGGGGGFEIQIPAEVSNMFGGNRRRTHQESEGFSPFTLVHNRLQNIGAGGANIQFIIENNSGDPVGGFRVPPNLGDYFIGPGFEQLMQHLAENDPNRYGNPPASKTAVNALPIIRVTSELLDSDSSQCAVCKDIFDLGCEAKQLPCKHIYHSDCILPWLELHNSCPVCRYELPTDDPDYDHTLRGGQVAGNPPVNPPSARDGGMESQESAHAQPSRIRYPFNWPFRLFGSSPESSTSGSAGNDTNRESNSSGRGNPAHEPEGGQEDLD